MALILAGRSIHWRSSIKKLILVAFALLFFISSGLPSYTFALEQFNSEEAAQKHCPADTVVWLNLPSGIYHYKGQKWYGNTKHGAYVCEKEAVKEKKRASKRG
ncbi:MAG: hypothetical protein HY036_11715 [Nitrospirae bacterium]|nr:hypothetical protein [Nitrospirota bacterium]